MQILFTDMPLSTVRCMDQIGARGWGGRISPYILKITVAYAFIWLLRFHLSLTGLAVPCVPERSVEMTVRLQVDLVLSDTAATNCVID